MAFALIVEDDLITAVRGMDYKYSAMTNGSSCTANAV